jgi:hypothetical protein
MLVGGAEHIVIIFPNYTLVYNDPYELKKKLRVLSSLAPYGYTFHFVGLTA